MSDVLGVRIVPPRGRKQIRKDARQLREVLGLAETPYFPIMQFIEWLLPLVDPEFVLEPVPDNELIGRSAETIPDQHLIRVKQSVYDAACQGHPWARQIMAHEVAHYLYHDSRHVAYAAPSKDEEVPKRFMPEYQANVFAAELLAPVDLVRGLKPATIAQRFGVPEGMAKGQLRQAAHAKSKKRKSGQTKSPTASQQSSLRT